MAKRTGLHESGVKRHIKNLEDVGVLIFDTRKENETKTYKWSKGKPAESNDVQGRIKSTQRIAHYIYEKGKSDARTISRELDISYISVGRILVGLGHQGFITGEVFETDIIPYENAPIMLGYIDHIRAAIGGDTRLMTEQLDEFRRNESLFRRYLNAGIELYRSVSSQINAKIGEEQRREILDFVKSYKDTNSQGPRPVEIEQGVKIKQIDNYLKYLTESGALTKVKIGAAVRYETVD